MNSEQKYLLQNYLYQKKADSRFDDRIDQELWNSWHYMILIEADQPFFDTDCDTVGEELCRGLNLEADYLNLNPHQSLLLFTDEKQDYKKVAKYMYFLLKRKHVVRFHLAVSPCFEGYQNLQRLRMLLEHWLDGRFYHLEDHVLFSEDEELAHTSKEELDSKLIQNISNDVLRGDEAALEKHFRMIENKYCIAGAYSAVYVKYIFSSVIEQLYQDQEFARQHDLASEIVEVFTSSTVKNVIDIARRNIIYYSIYIGQLVMSNRLKMRNVVEYVQTHYGSDILIEQLSSQFGLRPEYLTFLFHRETGCNICHYVHKLRMEKAHDLLQNTAMTWQQIAEEVGYHSPLYFARMYQLFYGESPR